MQVLTAIGEALAMAVNMAWEILWPLILGFTLSAVIQAVVRRERIAGLMSGSGPKALVIATGLGAASSSCSYAAVALARSLLRKGASFTSSMVFEIASTNLVVELGMILALALGWQFTLAEFIAGPIMIVFVALLFRLWLRRRIVEGARLQAERGVAGSMEGHAGMDMSVRSDGPFLRRLLSRDGLTSTSQYFVMDWAAVLRDIVVGLLIAGAFAAWVPTSWLRAVFLADDPTLAFVLGPLIGPLIAVVSFVCSVGNVPLAAVLWNGGISFGGRDELHLRRPDHHPDPADLPPLLRHAGHPGDRGDVLPGDGGSRVRHRAAVRPPRSDPDGPERPGAGVDDQLELHDLARHRVPRARRVLPHPVLPVRLRPHAAHDGRRSAARAHRSPRRRGARGRRRPLS
jgi:hypothetical protein